jgi:hypothetical protein
VSAGRCRRRRRLGLGQNLVRLRLTITVSSASRNPYYVAQRMVILGKANVLISQFADRLVGLEESVSPE